MKRWVTQKIRNSQTRRMTETTRMMDNKEDDGQLQGKLTMMRTTNMAGR